jgi:hypothetical protein
VNGTSWVFLLLAAAFAALAWTWFITWLISRYGNYEPQQEETIEEERSN